VLVSNIDTRQTLVYVTSTKLKLESGGPITARIKFGSIKQSSSIMHYKKEITQLKSYYINITNTNPILNIKLDDYLQLDLQYQEFPILHLP
jgi:hypothetical protein